jgi:tripartite-type tricarboxylate transporter receptor subunit TctC
MKHGIVSCIPILLAWAGSTPAADYPQRPVRLIVGVASGSSTDVVARVLGAKLAADLGQPFVIDNRPGAGGTIGTEIVIRATPDGHTLLVTSSTGQTVTPHLQKLPYHPINDLAPIGLVAWANLIIAAHPSFAAHSIQELIAQAKANPGKVAFGTSDRGSPSHMAVEMLQFMAGVRFNPIPYKGSFGAFQETLGGHLQVAVGGVLAALPFVRSRQLKAIAVTGAKRNPALPSTPTVAESGLPGYDVRQWWGLYAPAKTPPAIVHTLNKTLVKALSLREVLEVFEKQGVEVLPGTPEDFRRFALADYERWGKVIRSLGIQRD